MDPLTIALLSLSGFSTLMGAGTSIYNAAASQGYNQKLLQEQFNYQQKLNEQAFLYGQENADIAYKRQKELAYQLPSIQRAANKAAGLSTMSGGTGAAAPNVSMASTPSPGAAPSVSGAMQSRQSSLSELARSFASISDLGVDALIKKSQSDLLKSQEKHQDILNVGAAAEQTARIDDLVASKKLKVEQGEYLKNKIKLQEATMEDNIAIVAEELVSKRLSNDLKQNEVDMLQFTNELKKISVDMKRGEYEMLVKDLDSYSLKLNAGLSEIYSRIDLNNAKSMESAAERSLILAKKVGQDLANVFARVTRGADIAAKELINENIRRTYDLISKKIELAASTIDWTDAKAAREWLSFVNDAVSSGVDNFMSALKDGLPSQASDSSSSNSDPGSIYDLDTFGDDWDNPFNTPRKGLYGRGSLLE